MNKEVAYFVGCLVNTIKPDVGMASVMVLRRLGFQVWLPDQKCCGQPFFSTGNLKAIEQLARFNLNALGQKDCDIITSCPSCARVLKQEYPRLLETEDAEMVSRRSFDITEYLCRLWEENMLDVDFRPVDMSAVYHAPCHLRSVGEKLIRDRLKLMNKVPGFMVEIVDRGCCGMGGTFGLKRDTFGISMEIGQNLFQAIVEKKPDQVITDCTSCSLQIQQGTGLPVIHPAEVFQQAYQLSSKR